MTNCGCARETRRRSVPWSPLEPVRSFRGASTGKHRCSAAGDLPKPRWWPTNTRCRHQHCPPQPGTPTDKPGNVKGPGD